MTNAVIVRMERSDHSTGTQGTKVLNAEQYVSEAYMDRFPKITYIVKVTENMRRSMYKIGRR